MAHTSLIQVRVDDELKKDAEVLFENLGLDISSAVRIFLKQSVMRHGLSFPIQMNDEYFNENNLKTIEESIRQLKAGKVIVKSEKELNDFLDE